MSDDKKGPGLTPCRNRRNPPKLPNPAEVAADARRGLVEGDHGPRVEVTVERKVRRIRSRPNAVVEVTVEREVRAVNVLAAGEIEPAIVRTGETVEVEGEIMPEVRRVNRRPGSPLLLTLDRPRRDAAVTYALAVEIVASGGMGGGGGFADDRVDGGRGAREGRQLQAVAWAEKLRRLDAAIGGGVVRLNCEGGSIGVHALVRAVAVGGLSLPRILATLGLCRSRPRESAMKAAIFEALGRMAVALGDDRAGDRRKKPLTTAHANITPLRRSGIGPAR